MYGALQAKEQVSKWSLKMVKKALTLWMTQAMIFRFSWLSHISTMFLWDFDLNSVELAEIDIKRF